MSRSYKVSEIAPLLRGWFQLEEYLQKNHKARQPFGLIFCDQRSFEAYKSSVLQKIDKKETHVLVRIYFMKVKSSKKTIEKLDQQYSEAVIRIFYKWFQTFRSDHKCTSFADHSF